MPRWKEIADELRAAIVRGDYPPGATLPKIVDLMATYRASRITVRQAIGQLTAEGLVDAVRRRGTVVRRRPPRQRITRSRTVLRDEIGYYFDPVAQPWRALRTPTVSWGPAPFDVAAVLGVAAGAQVLIRDRVIGDPATGQVTQLATSYLPEDLTHGTVLAEADTGPGGIYDRLEEMGHGPLQWVEALSARMPTPDEAELLKLALGVPVLRITRTTTNPAGRVVEVNDTRMDAERFQIDYAITRS
ncbi:GntR family transcriptional regulator [Actinomadura roseirufa]|uniref:GntR family transcriptional regulator n=1 Tax=Actinomadura roseirufa TaxID=2094049 RepID=UPI0010417B77|nr:GntR family transcriptional regulator [Actinomadura roseirufa]